MISTKAHTEPKKLELKIDNTNILLTYPPLHFVVCRLGSWHVSVFGPLPSQSSSASWPYRLSPGLAISALVCLDFAFCLPVSAISFSWHHLSRLCTCPNHLNLFSLRNSAIGYTCASFQMSTFLTWSSLVFPLAHRSMRISVVRNSLSYFFLTAQHSAPYTMAGFIAVLYSLSFNFVGMFLSHITPVVSLHFDQAIFPLLLTSFSAPPLASNIETRYFNLFTLFTSFSWM